MKTGQSKRSYSMTARAEAVAENERKIMEAVVDQWLNLPAHDITLERVAELSGVTVRTILRKYSSKEGLLEACVESANPDILNKREAIQPGDVKAALSALLEEYEEMGDSVVRTIAIEEEMPFAGKLLKKGRKVHRAWCARVFAPYLLANNDPAYEIQLAAIIAATEIYLWKLLRRDMGHSKKDTYRIFSLMVEGVLEKIAHQKR